MQFCVRHPLAAIFRGLKLAEVGGLQSPYGLHIRFSSLRILTVSQATQFLMKIASEFDLTQSGSIIDGDSEIGVAASRSFDPMRRKLWMQIGSKI